MKELGVIPQPVEIDSPGGVFAITPETRIDAGEGAGAVADYLGELLSSALGSKCESTAATGADAKADTILLTTAGADESLGAEGYELNVTSEGVEIRAPHAAGLFYGTQTLRQLLPPDIENPRKEKIPQALEIPCVVIKDYPRFVWRGLHLDVARHFFSVSTVKRYIDLLAMLKMNVFHWHLIDDQGWRLEIKKYPKLTEIGSRREATPFPSDSSKLDGVPYGGFYTQEQIRDVVEYAARRFVTVLPEIEMPGHAVSALAAYPELGCAGGPYKVRTFWGIEEDVYCAGSERVFEFIEDVLTETLELFPSRYIHIGGDECPKAAWRKCPKCQARIADEGLKSEDELQSYFIDRIARFLKEKGRRLIGWDEILEGGLAPGATVMSWRGMGGGVEAARLGHDTIMCPLNYTYFDYYQSEDQAGEPPAIGGYTPLETVYEFDPVPVELRGELAGHILGAQGQLWTEYIPDERQLDYMAFPRALALAEALWTGPGAREFADFMDRLPRLLQRLERLNINFRDPFRKVNSNAEK